eukprot:Em0025g111a
MSFHKGDLSAFPCDENFCNNFVVRKQSNESFLLHKLQNLENPQVSAEDTLSIPLPIKSHLRLTCHNELRIANSMHYTTLATWQIGLVYSPFHLCMPPHGYSGASNGGLVASNTRTPPSAPNITVTGSSDTLTVIWTSVATATSYNARISGSTLVITIEDNQPLKASFTTLSNSTVYTVSVVAINCAGSSSPAKMNATTVRARGLLLFSTTQLFFRIFECGTCYTSVLTIPTPKYFNGTTVMCKDGISGILIGSDTLNIQMTSPPRAPNITVSDVSSKKLTVTWTSVSTATSYNVTINDSVNTLVAIPSTGAPQYKWNFTGLTSNTVYTVSVVAINCVGSNNTHTEIVTTSPRSESADMDNIVGGVVGGVVGVVVVGGGFIFLIVMVRRKFRSGSLTINHANHHSDQELPGAERPAADPIIVDKLYDGFRNLLFLRSTRLYCVFLANMSCTSIGCSGGYFLFVDCPILQQFTSRHWDGSLSRNN